MSTSESRKMSDQTPLVTDHRDLSDIGPPIKEPLLAIENEIAVASKVVPIRQRSTSAGGAHLAEAVLIRLLPEVDSLETMAESDFRSVWLPTADLRPVYEWALKQYEAVDGSTAPTPAMFWGSVVPGYGGRSWGDLLSDYDINIDDPPQETVEWAIEELRTRYLTKTCGEWSKRLAEAITSAPSDERIGVFQKYVKELTSLAEQPEWGGEGGDGRKLTLTPLSEVRMLATRWLWDGRIALGTFALLAGREGIGKSTIAYTIAADVTQGRLTGHSFGTPRSVIIAATEDSFSRTIVPRLVGANADLKRVFRVEVQSDGLVSGIDLPTDLLELEAMVRRQDVALILLDPLTSRLSETLDTHKDADVRQALEPIASIAERNNCVALGIIHVNKSSGKDAGDLIMGSRAFNAVARSSMMVVVSPEEPDLRILAMAKNNLGRMDLDALTYRIDGQCIGLDENDEEVWTGKVEWVGSDTRHISELIEAAHKGPHRESQVELCMTWLSGTLSQAGGSALVAEVKHAAKEAGFSPKTIRTASEELEVERIRLPGKPPVFEWRLPS